MRSVRKQDTRYLAALSKRGQRKGQVGVEYMIVVGFVTLAIMSILALAYFYSGQIKDRIRLNQIESFASQVISSAESVFFQGEPSKTTVRLYLPDGVESIVVASDALVITTTTSSGQNVRVFTSEVPLTGSIPTSEGIKKLVIEARTSDVSISPA